jgi:Na+-driven multidrug efflux pump
MFVFTSDPALIETGSEYLRAVCPSYLFMGIAQIYLCILRSTERVKIGTLINSAALILNICLNTLVVFGFFGFPKLGVRGVAWATSVAWGIDMLWCIAESARNKMVRLSPLAVFRRGGILFKDFMHYSLPVLANELVWGIGFTMYSVIMGHMGSDMAAANSVSTAVRNLATAASLAVASGGGILLGKELGQQQMEKAKKDASRLCKTALVCGIAGGGVVLLTMPAVLNLVTLTERAKGFLATMLFINTYYVIGKTMNTTVIVGVFCSGGDSRFGLICDIFTMWLFAVPLGFFNAFVLRIPAMAVYFMLFLDEFVKMPFVNHHYHKYGWLKNITRDSLN